MVNIFSFEGQTFEGVRGSDYLCNTLLSHIKVYTSENYPMIGHFER